MFWRITTFWAVLLCAVATASGKNRVWTSADGRTMNAEFVGELDGDVTFRKDGKLVVIRLEKLSDKDQQVVKDLAAGKQPDDGASPASAAPAENQKPAGNEGDSDKRKKPVKIQTRTWTDRFGIKSSGKFVRVDGNDIVLSRGTRVLTVPFGNLSPDDQEYVRELLTSQGKEDLIPSDTPSVPGNGEFAGGAGGVGGAGGGIAGGGVGGAGMPGRMPGAAGGFPGGAFPPGIGPRGGIGGAGAGMPGGIGGPMRGPGMPGGNATGIPPGMAPPGAMGPMGTAGFPGSERADTGMAGANAGGMAGMPGMGGATAGMPTGMMPPRMESAGMGGAGMAPAGMRGARMDSVTRMSPPSIPEPTFSTPTFEQTYSCSGCGARISQAESSLTKCPRCGITWGYTQDRFGNKTMTGAGTNMARVGIVIVIVVLLGGVVFIALFVGIIVAIVKAASASPARPPQPQRYY